MKNTVYDIKVGTKWIVRQETIANDEYAHMEGSTAVVTGIDTGASYGKVYFDYTVGKDIEGYSKGQIIQWSNESIMFLNTYELIVNSVTILQDKIEKIKNSL